MAHADDPGQDLARPCGARGLWALRGTYVFTATAWQDLSQLNPALPTGYAPVTIIGAFKVNGNGDVGGWALVNAGGLALTAEFVDSRFGAPRADCSIPITLSMRMKEFGEAVAGPYTYVGVPAGEGTALVELDHAKRISMRFD